MSSQNTILIIALSKTVLSIVLAFLFWKRNMHRRFPAMGAYLALQVVSAPVPFYLDYCQMRHGFENWPIDIYFYAYWAIYIANAVFLYFICMEVFRSALSSFSGLMKFGTVAFRWVALVSVIIGLTTIPFSISAITMDLRASLIVPSIAYGLTHSISILEICLLAFLCLSMNALRLSVRNAGFGISLGFGILSASEFVQTLLTRIFTSTAGPIHLAGEVVLLSVLSLWIVYFALPEPTPKPVLMSANSTIYRWNEIASALGHTGTKVAIQQPANGFFLTDVERVVEKVLTRNLKSSESDS